MTRDLSSRATHMDLISGSASCCARSSRCLLNMLPDASRSLNHPSTILLPNIMAPVYSSQKSTSARGSSKGSQAKSRPGPPRSSSPVTGSSQSRNRTRSSSMELDDDAEEENGHSVDASQQKKRDNRMQVIRKRSNHIFRTVDLFPQLKRLMNDGMARLAATDEEDHAATNDEL